MPQLNITTDDQLLEISKLWKYIQGNGKFYIPVYNSEESSAVYVETDVIGKKTLRAFMDVDAVQLYLNDNKDFLVENPESDLKVGIVPIRTLQKRLNETYGSSSDDGIIVECLLTTYDDSGNMMNVDVLWTQDTN